MSVGSLEEIIDESHAIVSSSDAGAPCFLRMGRHASGS
jgi:hypothetical protein